MIMNKRESQVSIEYLRECFDYDARTGLLRWKIRPSTHFKTQGAHAVSNWRAGGKVASTRRDNGYLIACVNGFDFRVHRIAWALHYGEWPKQFLDHINGEKTDNRIANLREVGKSENAINSKIKSTNKTGIKGVSYDRHRNKYRACLRINGRATTIGRYDTAAEASAAYAEASAKHHGEYIRRT